MARRSPAGTPRLLQPNSMFPSAVSHGKRACCWKTMPLPPPGPITSRPLTRTSPAVGATRPAITFRSVVLPHPLRPTSVTNSLSWIARSIPSRTKPRPPRTASGHPAPRSAPRRSGSGATRPGARAGRRRSRRAPSARSPTRRGRETRAPRPAGRALHVPASSRLWLWWTSTSVFAPASSAIRAAAVLPHMASASGVPSMSSWTNTQTHAMTSTPQANSTTLAQGRVSPVTTTDPPGESRR